MPRIRQINEPIAQYATVAQVTPSHGLTKEEKIPQLQMTFNFKEKERLSMIIHAYIKCTHMREEKESFCSRAIF